MSTQPKRLVELATYWTDHGGVNLGIVGNMRHCAGYHLGKDRIYSECACKPDGTCESGLRGGDYSVQHPRDKAGLTNAASAIDLGKLGGTLDNLYEFSRWLVRACQHGAAGSSDVREIIYSPDGANVQRYSGLDGAIHQGVGNGDASHIGHTHISYFRDAEGRDRRPLFAPYFAPPDTSTEPDMPGLTIAGLKAAPGTVRVKNIVGVQAVQVDDPTQRFGMPPGTVKETVAIGKLVGDPLGKDSAGSDRHTVRLVGDELAVLLADQTDFSPAPLPAPDCTNEVAAEHERTRAAAIAAVEGI